MGGSLRMLAVAVCAGAVACARGGDPVTPSQVTDGGGSVGGPDGGTPDGGPPDAGPPDGGPPDGGPPDGGPPTFGGPGPWPLQNITSGQADGLLAGDLGGEGVIGFSTDETQNQWVATRGALYLMRPGDKTFRRYEAKDGLHLQSNPQAYCDSWAPDKACPLQGAAANPGISEIVGGGPNEVFVGYFGIDDTPGHEPNYTDPNRHSGKLDRVRLKADGSLEVNRFDMVSGVTTEFWHNRTVQRLVYDHFFHPHTLYVGTNHGVDMMLPDKFRLPKPGEWFNDVNKEWMSDHVHPQVCFHASCGAGETGLRLGDWRGLAPSPDGHLWVAGRWAAGKVQYTPDLSVWFENPRVRGSKKPEDQQFVLAFGGDYLGNCSGNRPVFCPPLEGDPVAMSAVSVGPTGLVWFASGPYYYTADDRNYGVASYDGRTFTYYDPVRDLGMVEANVRDLIALPDGRVVAAGPDSGIVIWDPIKKTSKSIRGGSGLPDDHVNRLELDAMVSPPILHVSTRNGATSIRIVP
jgi:hypothetical protein